MINEILNRFLLKIGIEYQLIFSETRPVRFISKLIQYQNQNYIANPMDKDKYFTFFSTKPHCSYEIDKKLCTVFTSLFLPIITVVQTFFSSLFSPITLRDRALCFADLKFVTSSRFASFYSAIISQGIPSIFSQSEPTLPLLCVFVVQSPHHMSKPLDSLSFYEIYYLWYSCHNPLLIKFPLQPPLSYNDPLIVINILFLNNMVFSPLS